MSKKSELTIQEKMQRLEELVGWFESNDVDIDEALKKYETAMKLAGELQDDIKNAKNKFTKLKKNFAVDD